MKRTHLQHRSPGIHISTYGLIIVSLLLTITSCSTQSGEDESRNQTEIARGIELTMQAQAIEATLTA